jgi:NAD(P)-dependent dehydrogenase (short-subunit alcohol dehydrogenase family)
MSDESDSSQGRATTGAAHGGEGAGAASEVSGLRRFTSKLARFAVGRRDSTSRRRQEIPIPGRVYSDGPHGAESRPSGPDATRAVRRSGRRWDGSRCLVTGASSGLGRAIAEHLVRAGARVVLTGRSIERLGAVTLGLIAEGADPDRIIAVPADLTVEADRQRLFAEAVGHFGALELVINNAGVGAAGPFHTHDPDVLRRIFEINVFAMIEVCRAALPLLAAGHHPTLVNVGSIVARRGLPGRAEYAASKFAVTGFTECLRIEWRRFGIHVLQVNPGFTDTPFDGNAVVNTARYSVAHHRVMSADAVAVATLRAAARGKREITLTRQGKLLVLLGVLAPRFVDWGFARWLCKYYPEAAITQEDDSARRVPGG